jgi:hypothetical protein
VSAGARILPGRVHVQRVRQLLGLVGPGAAEPAEQLLCAVPDEQPADDQADEQAADLHGASLRVRPDAAARAAPG